MLLFWLLLWSHGWQILDSSDFECRLAPATLQGLSRLSSLRVGLHYWSPSLFRGFQLLGLSTCLLPWLCSLQMAIVGHSLAGLVSQPSKSPPIFTYILQALILREPWLLQTSNRWDTADAGTAFLYILPATWRSENTNGFTRLTEISVRKPRLRSQRIRLKFKLHP
jgi:hypothetical protein